MSDEDAPTTVRMPVQDDQVRRQSEQLEKLASQLLEQAGTLNSKFLEGMHSGEWAPGLKAPPADRQEST